MSITKSTLVKLFCLEGLFLDRIEVIDKIINLHVRSSRTRAICPLCLASTPKVHKKTIRIIKHGKCDDKIVNLRLLVRDFKCQKKGCGHLFRETVPGIDRRRTSAHYRQSIIPKVKNRSFRDVALEYGLSSSGLIKSCVDLMNESGIIWPDQPFELGIDEHSFSGRDLMITITDLTNHRVLAILEDDRQYTFVKFLENIPEISKKMISGVCIDMNSSYLTAIKRVLSENMPVVIDKFHVIQYFNWHLDQLRQVYTSSQFPLPKKLLEKNKEDLIPEEKIILKNIFKYCPPIAELWRLKEIVRKMYRIKKDPPQAIDIYQTILNGLRGDPRPRWQVIYKTLTKWKPYILNYFNLRITNAYTEGVHTRFKLLKRVSYGFRNKINYIAKMTLAFLPLATLLEMLKTSPSLT